MTPSQKKAFAKVWNAASTNDVLVLDVEETDHKVSFFMRGHFKPGTLGELTAAFGHAFVTRRGAVFFVLTRYGHKQETFKGREGRRRLALFLKYGF